MPRYRFEQIAINSTDKKQPIEADKHTYLGLEHLDSDCLDVTRYGADVAPIGEKLIMKKGDVLFGKRRAYQRKVAIAPFDGIFSAHGMVLRPRTEVIRPDLFPFFISSNQFLNSAIQISVGSLSPTINWRDLKDLEFDIPEINDQTEFARLLWSTEEARKAYRRLIFASEQLVKSRFIEMFGDPVTNPMGWPVYELGSISSSRLGKMLDAKQQAGNNRFPYLANFNVQWFRFDLSELNQMDFDEAAQQEFQLQYGDLMVCEGGEIGRCAIWRNEISPCFYQKAIHRIRCNKSILTPEYLAFWFFMFSQSHGFDDVVGNKTTIAHLPGVKLKKLGVIIPSLDLQTRFAAFVESTDKSKFALATAFKYAAVPRFLAVCMI